MSIFEFPMMFPAGARDLGEVRRGHHGARELQATLGVDLRAHV